jgi:hypothetical protein
MSATGSMGALHMLCRPACLNVVWSDWQGFDWCVRLKVQEAFAGSQAPGLRRHREGCPSPRDRGGYAVGRDEWDFAIAVHDGLQTFVVCLLVH